MKKLKEPVFVMIATLLIFMSGVVGAIAATDICTGTGTAENAYYFICEYSPLWSIFLIILNLYLWTKVIRKKEIYWILFYVIYLVVIYWLINNTSLLWFQTRPFDPQYIR